MNPWLIPTNIDFPGQLEELVREIAFHNFALLSPHMELFKIASVVAYNTIRSDPSKIAIFAGDDHAIKIAKEYYKSVISESIYETTISHSIPPSSRSLLWQSYDKVYFCHYTVLLNDILNGCCVPDKIGFIFWHHDSALIKTPTLVPALLHINSPTMIGFDESYDFTDKQSVTDIFKIELLVAITRFKDSRSDDIIWKKKETPHYSSKKSVYLVPHFFQHNFSLSDISDRKSNRFKRAFVTREVLAGTKIPFMQSEEFYLPKSSIASDRSIWLHEWTANPLNFPNSLKKPNCLHDWCRQRTELGNPNHFFVPHMSYREVFRSVYQTSSGFPWTREQDR